MNMYKQNEPILEIDNLVAALLKKDKYNAYYAVVRSTSELHDYYRDLKGDHGVELCNIVPNDLVIKGA